MSVTKVEKFDIADKMGIDKLATLIKANRFDNTAIIGIKYHVPYILKRREGNWGYIRWESLTDISSYFGTPISSLSSITTIIVYLEKMDDIYLINTLIEVVRLLERIAWEKSELNDHN